MKKSVLVVLLSAFAALPAVAQSAAPAKREMVYDATGRRLAPVDRITSDGSVEIIIDDKEVTIPASTLTVADGKVTTSLSKPQVIELLH